MITIFLAAILFLGVFSWRCLSNAEVAWASGGAPPPPPAPKPPTVQLCPKVGYQSCRERLPNEPPDPYGMCAQINKKMVTVMASTPSVTNPSCPTSGVTVRNTTGTTPSTSVTARYSWRPPGSRTASTSTSSTASATGGRLAPTFTAAGTTSAGGSNAGSFNATTAGPSGGKDNWGALSTSQSSGQSACGG